MNQEFSLNDYIVMLFNDTTFIEDQRLSEVMTMEMEASTIEAAEGVLLFIEEATVDSAIGQLTFQNSDISLLRINLEEEGTKVTNLFCTTIDSTLSERVTIRYRQYIKK